MAASLQNRVADLTIEADAQQVRHASIWLAHCGAEFGVPESEINRLDLCLNEALANVIDHGSPAALASPIHIHLDVQLGEEAWEATVTVSDAGLAFDTTSATAKTRPKTLAEAEPGGLGLVMIRSFSDWLGYRYHDGKNHLSFSVRWPPAA
ncbi:MAG: ATP-binding protein [Methylococcus sp.]|nr:MAG: ATP-binding protein [Methylococcus sp.]